MRFIYTKAFAILAGCLVLVCLLVILQIKGWLDPIRTTALQAPRPLIYLVSSVTLPVKTFFGTIYQLHKITQENSELSAKVSELEQQLVLENQESLEDQALRKELGFVKNSGLSLIPCTVLSENSFGLTDSLILNCGTQDGVTQGQAIISQGYLAGKIIYAGKNSSTALLSISSDFSIDAQVSQTGSTGLVRGSFGSGLIIDQVAQTSDLKTGWLVTTAGINDQVPKNILIGQVGDLLSSNSDLFKTASLVSPIDFNNLGFVFAVQN